MDVVPAAPREVADESGGGPRGVLTAGRGDEQCGDGVAGGSKADPMSSRRVALSPRRQDRPRTTAAVTSRRPSAKADSEGPPRSSPSTMQVTVRPQADTAPTRGGREALVDMATHSCHDWTAGAWRGPTCSTVGASPRWPPPASTTTAARTRSARSTTSPRHVGGPPARARRPRHQLEASDTARVTPWRPGSATAATRTQGATDEGGDETDSELNGRDDRAPEGVGDGASSAPSSVATGSTRACRAPAPHAGRPARRRRSPRRPPPRSRSADTRGRASTLFLEHTYADSPGLLRAQRLATPLSGSY